MSYIEQFFRESKSQGLFYLGIITCTTGTIFSMYKKIVCYYIIGNMCRYLDVCYVNVSTVL